MSLCNVLIFEGDMAALDQEYEFYKKNKEKLLPMYENKFIVIVGEEIIGVFDDDIEAVESVRKKHRPGTFLVQRVCQEEEIIFSKFGDYVIFSHSREGPTLCKVAKFFFCPLLQTDFTPLWGPFLKVPKTAAKEKVGFIQKKHLCGKIVSFDPGFMVAA